MGDSETTEIGYNHGSGSGTYDELDLDQYRRPYGRADLDVGEGIRVLSNQKFAVPPFMVHMLGIQDDDACSMDVRDDGNELVIGPEGLFDETSHFVESRGYHISLLLDDANFVEQRDSEDGIDVLLSLDTIEVESGECVAVIHVRAASEEDIERIDEAMADRYPYRSGRSNRERFEERVGIDTSDVLGDQAFTKMAFSDDWIYAKRSTVNFRGSDSATKKLSVPKPILLLSHFSVDDVVGLEMNEDRTMAMLVPSGQGDMTVQFTRHRGRGNIRLRLPEDLPFGPDIWMTYDPDRDTIVMAADLSLFGVTDDEVVGLSAVAN